MGVTRDPRPGLEGHVMVHPTLPGPPRAPCAPHCACCLMCCRRAHGMVCSVAARSGMVAVARFFPSPSTHALALRRSHPTAAGWLGRRSQARPVPLGWRGAPGCLEHVTRIPVDRRTCDTHRRDSHKKTDATRTCDTVVTRTCDTVVTRIRASSAPCRPRPRRLIPRHSDSSRLAPARTRPQRSDSDASRRWIPRPCQAGAATPTMSLHHAGSRPASLLLAATPALLPLRPAPLANGPGVHATR
jgi:hypothetical protein